VLVAVERLERLGERRGQRLLVRRQRVAAVGQPVGQQLAEVRAEAGEHVPFLDQPGQLTGDRGDVGLLHRVLRRS
jgi:hypothetical protein